MLKLRITPIQALITAGVAGLIALVVSAITAVQQPWLGISLVQDEAGLRVDKVEKIGPSAGILYVDDVIVTMADMQGNSIRLQQQDIVEDPDTIRTLRERNSFHERQSRIFQMLVQPIVMLTLDDGRLVRIQPQPTRPISSFPAAFWLLSLYATTALLVGAAVWAVKQRTAAAKFLLLSGVGTTILLHAVKIVTLRELAIDGALYPWLTFVYHLGYNFFALGLIGLVWWYPKTLGSPALIPGLVLFMSFFMLNEQLEWMEFPGNSVFFQVPFYIVAAVAGMRAQWINSRGSPLERASIKAVMLVVWIAILVMALFYCTSVLLFDTSKLSLNSTFSAMFAIYIVLSLAVIRYHLFEIDRWWLEIWIWFFAGVVIVVLDLLLAMLAPVAPNYILGASVIIAAWVYFPARQWIWKKWFPHSRRKLDEYVPMIVGRFIQAERGDRLKMWKGILFDVFRPLSIEAREYEIAESSISDSGIRLIVPSLIPGQSLELYYADKGARLFNNSDSKLSYALLNVSRTALAQRESYAKGVSDERKRIMRDLHEDVGSRLLTLTRSSQGESAIATEALKSLREIIYALDTEQQVTLNNAVDRWRIEAMERCELAGIAFEWLWEAPESDIQLLPRMVLNLTLVLREALSNVSAHAQNASVNFQLHKDRAGLHVQIRNNGVKSPDGSFKLGKGLRNMRIRIGELGGRFEYALDKDAFRVLFDVPLPEEGGHA